eukprot:8977009-Pyramimonas_sp.AAC.1
MRHRARVHAGASCDGQRSWRHNHVGIMSARVARGWPKPLGFRDHRGLGRRVFRPPQRLRGVL